MHSCAYARVIMSSESMYVSSSGDPTYGGSEEYAVFLVKVP